MNRRQAREKAVQALFQITVGQTDAEEAIHNVQEMDKGSQLNPLFELLVHQTIHHMPDIDEQIKKHLINWQFDRIANIDKTILRLGTCELLYLDDIPTSVSLNEAVELAKLFGDEKTRKFVNGILSQIAVDLKKN
ncbi:transcription antitermination factor NusB [Terrilactibacillus sp. BCM23-1]|uniref:Transcription antitermination protein NusB n=1 Tax=Terrilactibacillus tamarindi TaxID=2599694 RepID=A0A6N8CTV6_9BACI|nr:transcription antitermination factor NusB [Terrilactibacillus tamarindi]MTT32687.1 transcription antitermination factor NusB [Terrilactibacillus tamarindi]